MSKLLTKEWLRAASDDILLLSEIKDNAQLTSIIAFHSQQAVEKSLKALLCYKDEEIPKIHSLNKLVSLSHFTIKNEDGQIINKLDKLYIDSRYPGDLGLLPYGKPTCADAIEFYDFARAVFDSICELLNINKNELNQ